MHRGRKLRLVDGTGQLRRPLDDGLARRSVASSLALFLSQIFHSRSAGSENLGGLLTVGSSLPQSADSTQQPDIPCYSPLRSSGRETSSRTAFQILAGLGLLSLFILGCFPCCGNSKTLLLPQTFAVPSVGNLPLKPLEMLAKLRAQRAGKASR